jgi:hypothetical protein
VPQAGKFVGTVSVDSRPAGASVTIDGRRAGTTPLSVGDLAAGSHVILIELNGYERWSAAVRVVANRTISVKPILQPVRRRLP